MIHFLMVKPKNEISDSYVVDTLIGLTNQDREYSIYEQNDRQWKAWVIIQDERYFLELQMNTYNSIKHLAIQIIPQKLDDRFDKKLYDLKLVIKSLFRRDWNECLWIVDEQSTRFAEELYGRIHRVENLLRQFINIVMIRKFGVEWWDGFVPYNLKEKYDNRRSGYRAVSPTFSNVSDRLISIDTDDLLTVMTHKIKRLSLRNITEIEIILESLKERDEAVSLVKSYKNLINKLKTEMDIQQDLWVDIFSKYFLSEFIDEWKRFCKNRNHVAHNKLLDLEAYEKISESINIIDTYLKTARENFETELSEEEETELNEINFIAIEVEKERQKIQLQMMMQEETGVSISDECKIFEQFKNEISQFIENISDFLYFRRDVDVETEELSIESDEQELLVITSQMNNNEFKIISVGNIDEEAGGQSEFILKLFINGEEESVCTLTYTNGNTEYNNELGYFMPLTYNEFSYDELLNFEEELKLDIEYHFANIKEEMDSAKYSSIKDGGNYPVADFACDECNEEYVSIDESILDIGKCGNCGNTHNLETCFRCEEYYNSDWEGQNDFCDSCYEYFERQ